MEISVFIPSIPRSFHNLQNLIDIYNNGTCKPDEIIINASMVNERNCELLNNLNKENVKLFTNNYKIEAGPNRQMASYLSTGDVIIYQDDDDIPSNRRVEIIKYFFENKDIVALNHSYVYNQIVSNLDDLKLEDIGFIESNDLYNKYFPNKLIEDCVEITKAYGGGFDIPVCAGPISIRKEVLNDIIWKEMSKVSLCKNGHMRRGEDFDFCMEVLYKYNKSLIIDAEIYSYLK